MKIGDAVRLVSTKEIDEQAAKNRGIGPDVELGEIGHVVEAWGVDGKLFDVAFPRAVVACNNTMVEVVKFED
jgi:hypothetical protein